MKASSTVSVDEAIDLFPGQFRAPPPVCAVTRAWYTTNGGTETNQDPKSHGRDTLTSRKIRAVLPADISVHTGLQATPQAAIFSPRDSAGEIQPARFSRGKEVKFCWRIGPKDAAGGSLIAVYEH